MANESTLNFSVENQIINASSTNPIVVENAINYVKIHIDFDEHWNGVRKTAIFVKGQHRYASDLDDEGNVMVPNIVVRYDRFALSVQGVDESGNVVISSSLVVVPVKATNSIEGAKYPITEIKSDDGSVIVTPNGKETIDLKLNPEIEQRITALENDDKGDDTRLNEVIEKANQNALYIKSEQDARVESESALSAEIEATKTAIDSETDRAMKAEAEMLESAKVYTNQKISDVLGGASEAFDTLKEVEDYIASDKSGAVAMTEAITKNASDIEQVSKGLTNLGTDLATEKTNRENADTALGQRITTIEGDYLKGVDKTALHEEVVAEETRAKKVETEHSATIANLNSHISYLNGYPKSGLTNTLIISANALTTIITSEGLTVDNRLATLNDTAVVENGNTITITY